MTSSLDRRRFLRRLGAAGLVAPVAHLLSGCVPDTPARARRAAAGDDPPSGGGLVERPVLMAGDGGVVHLEAPMVELPRAYVSLGRRQVFVDYDYRDQARWVLGAHISVSTGLWRIRLRGDPRNQFVVPGDELREFEELDIAEWDPRMRPTEGDFRIGRGRPVPLSVRFSCLPVSGSDAWLSGGPWEIVRCEPFGIEPCREDFIEVGVARRSPLRGCASGAGEARVLTWAHLG